MLYSASGIKVMIGRGGGCLIGLRLGIMVSSMGRGEAWVGGGGVELHGKKRGV